MTRLLRQRLTWLLTFLIILSLLGGSGLSALAVWQPFTPGDALFPLQHWAEQMRLILVVNPTERAERLLTLAEERLTDLDTHINTPHELLALAEFDGALNRAVAAIAATPTETQGRLRTRLATLAARYKTVLQQMTTLAGMNPEVYAAATAQAEALLQLANRDEPLPDTPVAIPTLGVADATSMAAATSTPTPVNIAAHPVPFPPNATPGPHDFYPLTGQHAVLACSDCHASGFYQGTSKLCADCHSTVQPVNHFPGACDQCHVTEGWTLVNFDHTGFTDCVGCHTPDKPANHFAGQCSACHTTSGWLPASFDHTGFTDCVACHTPDKPANHFAGQCSACHTTSGWLPANFNHAGATDCLGCHLADRPVPHYEGQCSSCHNTDTWQGAIFDHSGIGTTDCVACHAPPANHFPGTCRDCHTDTTNWHNATFDHSFPMNHEGANGNCTTCHPGNDYAQWTCTACHEPDRMDDKHDDVSGYSNNCIACHPDGRVRDD